jgi:3D (Asp-Asp-Asp) domain-containing protein
MWRNIAVLAYLSRRIDNDVHLIKLYGDVHLIKLYGDSQLVEAEGHHERTNHIDIYYHYIKDTVHNGYLQLQHVGTKDVAAEASLSLSTRRS